MLLDSCDCSSTPRSNFSLNRWNFGPEGEPTQSPADIHATKTLKPQNVSEINDTFMEYKIDQLTEIKRFQG